MSDCIIIYKPVGKTTGTVFTNEEFKEFVINNPAIFKQYLEGIKTFKSGSQLELFSDTLKSSTSVKPTQPTVISKDYGVVQVNTNPSPEFTNQILDIISDNVRKNAYVENGSGTANLMFSFGWQWKGNNSKKLAGRKLNVTPAEVDYNANGKRTRVNSKYFYDSKYNNGTDVPSIDKLNPLKRHIEKHLGIDLSDYDVALNNIYTEGTALYRHTDIDESNTAKGYPVVVYVLGNEHKVRIDDNEGKRLMGEMVNPKTMSLKNGDVYTFGMDGKGRFETVHDVIKANKSVSYPPITLPDGRVVTNYTVTFTFRRAADLEAGMPSTPAKLTTSTQPSTSVKPTQPITQKKTFFTLEKATSQKSFRKKVLNFVDKIVTEKDSIVAMSNNRKTGIISINAEAMKQKFIDKAWTKPSKQLDGSFATALPENQFKSFEEFFTFALIHEVKHDTIFKVSGETTGQYEDRINSAALSDLQTNYNNISKFDGIPELPILGDCN